MNKTQDFVPPHSLNTAVLFLVFNRMDTTKEVFQAIRQAKPPRLYIACDGARENKDGETERVKKIRDYILENIDWNCEVETLFREQNLGCKYAVSEAITWFFKNEEQGIILEDDCLPTQSFFWFCEKLLEKYKYDQRVGQISGVNFQKGIKRGDADYYFSVFNHIWGWASWADRWDKYDVNLEEFENTNFIKKIFKDRKSRNYWKEIFGIMKKQAINTWDYQWTFTLWKNEQLAITPNLNLIKNIGFGEGATHTTETDSEFANVVSFELILNQHPSSIERNIDADNFTSKYVFNKPNILSRIIKKLKRIMNEL